MAVVEELIRVENENGLSFGDYTLNAKKKVSDFEFHGDMYKVKTYRDIMNLYREHLYSISKKRMSERNLKSKALKIRRLHWNWKLNRNMKFLWMM